MKENFRKILFPQMLDYICGKSNLLFKEPRWSMKDIEDFWSLKWDAAPRPKS
jgi:hypothetical protein